MHRIFILILVAVSSSLLPLHTTICSLAQTVSVDVAKQRAQNFFSSQEVKSRTDISEKPTASVTLAHTATSAQGNVHFYVFNRQGGGWVIIGGDDVARQVLAFSDQGFFDYQRLPANTKHWLCMYESEIDSALSAPVPSASSASSSLAASVPSASSASSSLAASVPSASPEGSSLAASAGADIEPLTFSEWDQWAPFNNMTPEISGTHCPVGCTSLTVAQIMKYHAWPASGIGSHSYYDSGSAQTLTANFSARDYDWNLLVSDYEEYYPVDEDDEALYGEARRNALAELFYDIAVATETQFGTDGSSSTLDCARSALASYFQYDSLSMKTAVATHYDEDTWVSMLYDELAASRPFIYAAVDSTKGGHAFLCDGYKFQNDTHYFNFKWGWKYWDWTGVFSGPDGWYALSALNPLGLNFFDMHHVLMGIQPVKPDHIATVTIDEPDTAIVAQRLGGHVFLPSHADTECGVFVGWTPDEILEKTIERPTIIQPGYYTPTSDVSLHPVFTSSVSTFTPKTVVIDEHFSDIDVGEYVISGRWSGNSNFQELTDESYIWQADQMIALGWQHESKLVTKTIHTHPGDLFTLSFKLKGYQYAPSAIRLYIGDRRFYDLYPTATYDDNMQTYSYMFFADEDSMVVSWSIEKSMDRFVFIDDIVITTGGAPIYYSTNQTDIHVPLTVTDVHWATFYSPYSVQLDPGLKAYTIWVWGIDLMLDNVADGDKPDFNTVPAFTPVLIHGTGFDDTYTKEYIDKYDFCASHDTYNGNILLGTMIDSLRLSPGHDDYINYVLQKRGGRADWYKVVYDDAKSKYNTVPAFHAYLSTNVFYYTTKSKLSLPDDPATGIAHVESDSPTTDTTHQPVLYNINGQRVSPDYRGIVIRNHRKYLK